MHTIVSGSLYADNVTLRSVVRSRNHHFEATNLHVEGDMFFRGVGKNQKKPTDTKICLWAASVGAQLDFSDSKIREISAKEVDVRGSVILDCGLYGEANISGARVGGDVDLGNLKCFYLFEEPPRILMEDAHVARDLKVSNSIHVSKFVDSEWLAAPPIKICSHPLACYPGWQLVEALCERKEDDETFLSILSFLIEKRADLSDSRLPIVLDGSPRWFDGLNKRNALHLHNAKAVEEYLRLFCTHIWGDEGPFIIVDSLVDLQGADGLPDNILVLPPPPPRVDEGVWIISDVFVVYGNALFKTRFSVDKSGAVEMTDDEPIAEISKKVPVRYESPFRFVEKQPGDNQAEWPFRPTVSGQWTDWKDIELYELLRAELLKEKPPEKRVEIRLGGLRIGALNDNNGKNWGKDVQLRLDGFDYARIDSPDRQLTASFGDAAGHGRTGLENRDVGQLRVDWLRMHLDGDVRETGNYNPQPYEQLVNVLRSQGDYEAATVVSIEKLRIERALKKYDKMKGIGRIRTFLWHWLKRPFLWLYEMCFGYGLIPERAFWTFVACVLVGWHTVALANYGTLRLLPAGSGSVVEFPWPKLEPVMVVDATPVSTFVVGTSASDSGAVSETDSEAEPATMRVPSGSGVVKEIRCKDQIESILYALDVFVPLLDLKQEPKCTITAQNRAWLWRWGKSGYAVLGWLVTSLTILTVSGVTRRYVEK
jgi:hypothetical protein